MKRNGANQPGAVLSVAMLVGFDMSGANFREANFRNANLTGAILNGSDLTLAHACGVNLQRAKLIGANLSFADLRAATINDADLTDANLTGTNFKDAILVRACLAGANLTGAKFDDAVLLEADFTGAVMPDFQLPQGVAIRGWKKLRDDVIAELEIPAKARRTASLIGRKCRAEYAVVVSLSKGDSGVSIQDDKVTYTVGQTVKPRNWYDDDFRLDCAPGIHFFRTRDEAEQYLT